MKTKKAGRPVEINYPTISTLSSRSFKAFSETLFHKGVISIPNIGKFELRKTKSRRTYHNFSDKVITVKGRQRVHFVPLGKLKALLK
jgi:nucleoid DNA-binding protein